MAWSNRRPTFHPPIPTSVERKRGSKRSRTTLPPPTRFRMKSSKLVDDEHRRPRFTRTLGGTCTTRTSCSANRRWIATICNASFATLAVSWTWGTRGISSSTRHQRMRTNNFTRYPREDLRGTSSSHLVASHRISRGVLDEAPSARCTRLRGTRRWLSRILIDTARRRSWTRGTRRRRTGWCRITSSRRLWISEIGERFETASLV